jgi:drug/metabolite transporter (DMT)-like permease
MRSSLATLLPLGSAFGYTFAALLLKRATENGGGPWRITFLANWMVALVFCPWVLAGGHPVHLTTAAQAMLAGGAFFIGQIFTFLALSRGDVSLTTPFLGTKVLFVALLSPLCSGETLTSSLAVSALLTCIATALLGGEWKSNSERLIPSLGYGTCAALAFAACDLMQQRWGAQLGFGHFAPIMFGTIGLLTCTLIPFFPGPLRELPKASLLGGLCGGLLLALQATGIAFSIATFHEVTLTNILYATRGIWSVLLVWAVGHWFGNFEKSIGPAVMKRRLAGAALLLCAVLWALLAR